MKHQLNNKFQKKVDKIIEYIDKNNFKFEQSGKNPKELLLQLKNDIDLNEKNNIIEQLEIILKDFYNANKGSSNGNELFVNRNNANIEELKARMKTFPNEYSSDMVIVRDIDFDSICEHHWLPFSGKVTVGYVPNDKVIGLSKIPRVVKYFSRKPQLQEQLTTEIGEYLYNLLEPRAIFVEVEESLGCDRSVFAYVAAFSNDFEHMLF